MFESHSHKQVIDCNFIYSGSRFNLIEEKVGQGAKQNSKYNITYNTNIFEALFVIENASHLRDTWVMLMNDRVIIELLCDVIDCVYYLIELLYMR